MIDGAMAQRAPASTFDRVGPADPEIGESWRVLLEMPSPAMRAVIEQIRRAAAATNTAVLVSGESGTGKTLVARALHAMSRRAAGPFVTLRCGDVPETRFGSMLFGHAAGVARWALIDRRGAVERADGGVLFLDEVANLPAAQQGPLVRMLRTGEFERVGSVWTRRSGARIVAATNVELGVDISRGRFAAELLERLATFEIRVPPLRDRPIDVPVLATLLLRGEARRLGRAVRGFEADALQALAAHPWPGNVRELEHAVSCAALAARGPLATIGDLGLRTWSERSPRLEDLRLRDAERLLIQRALARFDGNVRLAARALGLSVGELSRRRRRFGLLSATWRFSSLSG